MDDHEFLAILDCFFMFSFITSSELIFFLYRFIILLHLISSFLLTRCLVIPYAYVSIESTDYILLSSFERNAILLIYPIKILFRSLLNLCCVINIDLLFLMNSFWLFWYYLWQFYFFLDGLFYSHVNAASKVLELKLLIYF